MAARSSSVTWMYCAPPSPPSPAPAPSSSPNWSRSASTPSPSSTPSWRKSTNSCWLRSMSCGGCVALLSAFVRALRTRSRRLEGGATHRQQFRVARAELLQERLEERRVLLHERAQLAHDGRVAQLRQLARVTSGTGTGTCSCRLGRRTRGGSGFEEVAGGVGGGGCEGRPSQRAPQRRESSHAPGQEWAQGERRCQSRARACREGWRQRAPAPVQAQAPTRGCPARARQSAANSS